MVLRLCPDLTAFEAQGFAVFAQPQQKAPGQTAPGAKVPEGTEDTPHESVGRRILSRQQVDQSAELDSELVTLARHR